VSGSTSEIEDARAAWRDRVFLGHPGGLGWIAASEFWERFSYYGMQALLVLYMTHQLLHPGHIEHVLGFGPFRKILEAMYGPLSPQALASAVFGLYAGLVYLTPIGGGLLADRFIGRTWAVTIGASLMALGHFLMAFEQSFLLALLCLLIGVGCFKGNMASQVGDLYGPNDPRRADAFQVYLFAVQIAVIFSPLVCGTLGEVYGWHWGFGAAGVGMLIGLAIYLSGRSWLPKEKPIVRRGSAKGARPKLSRGDWRVIAILIALLPVLAVALVGNQEIFNAYLVWAEKNYQLNFFGRTMPITWILSMGSVVSAATIALSVYFWRWFATRWAEPDEITKIAIGVFIGALAPLLLAAAAAIVAARHTKVSLGWAVAFEIVNDIGFANVFPVALALYTRAAPKGITGIMIGVFYLHLFAGNLFVGWVGGLLDKMPATSFWLLHAGLVAGAAGVLLVVRYAVGRELAPAYEAPAVVHAAA
jgi:proton-dependent oligopeptide transporter, POT family